MVPPPQQQQQQQEEEQRFPLPDLSASPQIKREEGRQLAYFLSSSSVAAEEGGFLRRSFKKQRPPPPPAAVNSIRVGILPLSFFALLIFRVVGGFLFFSSFRRLS